MKRKVGTTLDENLYLKAKDVARLEGRSLNEVIAEALERFLASRRSGVSVVKETRGTFHASAKTLRTVLEEDLYETG